MDQIILNDIQLIIRKGFFLLPEDQSLPDFQAAVAFELLDGLFQRISLFFLILSQFNQGRESAGPHCAFLQVDLGDDISEELAADVLPSRLPADYAQDLEVDAMVVGGRKELGQLSNTVSLRLSAQLGDLEVHDLYGLGLDVTGVLLAHESEQKFVDQLVLFGVSLEHIDQRANHIPLVFNGHLRHGLFDAGEEGLEVGLAAYSEENGGSDGREAGVTVVQNLFNLLYVDDEALSELVAQQTVENFQDCVLLDCAFADQEGLQDANHFEKLLVAHQRRLAGQLAGLNLNRILLIPDLSSQVVHKLLGLCRIALQVLGNLPEHPQKLDGCQSHHSLLHERKQNLLICVEVPPLGVSNKHQSMALHVLILRGELLHDLRAPLLHQIFVCLEHLQSGQQSRTRYAEIWVDNKRLDVSLYLCEVAGIDDERNCAECVSAVSWVLVVYVLQEGTGDNVNGRVTAHFFDIYINCPSQGGVLGLKQLGDGKEELGALVVGEVLAVVDEVNQIHEYLCAFGRVKVGRIEALGLLHGGSLIDLHKGSLLAALGVAADIFLASLVPVLHQTYVGIHVQLYHALNHTYSIILTQKTYRIDGTGK